MINPQHRLMFRFGLSYVLIIAIAAIAIQWMQTEHTTEVYSYSGHQIPLSHTDEWDFSILEYQNDEHFPLRSAFIRQATSMMVVDDLVRWKIFNDDHFELIQFMDQSNRNATRLNLPTVPNITRKLTSPTLKKGSPLSDPSDPTLSDLIDIGVTVNNFTYDRSDKLELGFIETQDE